MAKSLRAHVVEWWKERRAEPAVIRVFPPLHPDQRMCPACRRVVDAWRTYADGHLRCVTCADEREQ